METQTRGKGIIDCGLRGSVGMLADANPTKLSKQSQAVPLQLPSSSSFNTILVIVDRLLKQAIFIPTYDTITSVELARLFITHVFSKHGVPSHVTFDCSSNFVSHFFCSLGTALDMRFHFTSGYHTEANGQAEWTNQTFEQYLHVYCNYQQDNWSELLPLAEFAYNNAPSATTGVSLFFANKRYHPNLIVYPEQDIASSRAVRKLNSKLE